MKPIHIAFALAASVFSVGAAHADAYPYCDAEEVGTLFKLGWSVAEVQKDCAGITRVDVNDPNNWAQGQNCFRIYSDIKNKVQWVSGNGAFSHVVVMSYDSKRKYKYNCHQETSYGKGSNVLAEVEQQAHSSCKKYVAKNNGSCEMIFRDKY